MNLADTVIAGALFVAGMGALLVITMPVRVPSGGANASPPHTRPERADVSKSVQRQMLELLERQQKAMTEMADVLIAMGFEPSDLLEAFYSDETTA